MKKLAIMQPYFLPYIGYWQLLNSVDEFIIYDNIQYTKKGWFNRNRYLKNGKDDVFSIPLKKDNDFLNVDKRIISNEYNKKKLIAQFQNAYSKAPYRKDVMDIFEEIINFDNDNLFEYIYNSVIKVSQYLDINTNIVKSSTICINHSLKGQNKVLALCKSENANIYINAIGGKELYCKEVFANENIELKFIKSKEIVYKQFENTFIPWLSIIDVMMFNSKDEIRKMLNEYELE